MEQTAPPKNILILGGSYAGISTTHYLLKHVIPALPTSPPYQIILISASSSAMCRPACPRALISDSMFDQEKLFANIAKQFDSYSNDSFRFIQGTATGLDHIGRSVEIELADGGHKKIEFYTLVIATGASTPSPLHGLNQDVEFLRTNWAAFRKALPGAKSSMLFPDRSPERYSSSPLPLHPENSDSIF